MRDLHKTLKRFASASAMEYCEEFDEVKSILEHCNRNCKPFNKLHFRGGNEAFINELSRRLQVMLVERQLVDATSKEPLPKAAGVLRKIVVFLLVNTDATYKYNLREDAGLAHVLEVCPLLPKFLLVTLVWDLRLDVFFYEALSYTPCWFAFQYFDPAADSLKFVEDPYAVLEKVEQLLRAIFISVARSERRQMDTVDKKIIYSKLYDYAMNLLRQFYTPDAEKFQRFSKKQFFCYSGFAIKHLLQLLLFAFDAYEMPQSSSQPTAVAAPALDVEIYDICRESCKRLPAATAWSVPSSALKQQQLRIIAAVQNSLQYNVMLVSMSVFLEWVEVDLTPKQSLQAAVGELAFQVCERISANSQEFGHDVKEQLKHISIRPRTLEEVVRAAVLGDILRALDEPLEYEVKRTWFNELFNRTVALGNDECLQSIRDNIKMMSPENCQQILDFIKLEIQRSQADVANDQPPETIKVEQMDVDGDDYKNLTCLILLALQNFSIEQTLQLLTYQTTLFGAAVQISCQSRGDFSSRAIEFLNKYSSESFDQHQFLILCFEQPAEMWSRFFDNACHNSAHVANFCATVKAAQPFSDSYFNELLNAAIRDEAKLQQKFFPELLCEIYFVLYCPERKTEFLKQFLNKHVNVMLEAQAFDSLLPLVRALNLIVGRGETQSHKPLNFEENTAPVLLMAAQIMDKSRWDLVTYTDVRDELVRECIAFIQHTSKIFLPVATEKDRKWVTKVVNDSYRPITQYYFQKFSLLPNQPAADFDRFLIRLEIEDTSEAQMFLIMNYIRCTMKETEWLARSERLLPHISEVMFILGKVITENDKTNALNNYRHCLANYANIVVKFIFPKIENDTQKVEELAMKILKIIKLAPSQLYAEIFMSLEWLLLETMKKCTQPLEENTVKAVQEFVRCMTDCRAKEIFLEKFQALAMESLN